MTTRTIFLLMLLTLSFACSNDSFLSTVYTSKRTLTGLEEEEGVKFELATSVSLDVRMRITNESIVEFSWNIVPDADRYQLRIIDVATQTVVEYDPLLTTTSVTKTKLFGGLQYRAYIRAIDSNKGQATRWAQTDFTLPFGRPLITVDHVRKTISWTRPDNAQSYAVAVEDLRVSPIVVTDYLASTTSNVFELKKNMPNSLYRVTVKARHRDGSRTVFGLTAERTNPELVVKLVPSPAIVMFGYGERAPSSLWNELLKTVNIVHGETTDAMFVHRLRTEGRVFAYAVPNAVQNKDSSAPLPSLADAVDIMTTPFRNTLAGALPRGFEAIAVDEANSYADGSERANLFAQVLQEIRRRYPEKMVLVAGVGKLGTIGATYRTVLTSIKDHADIYFQENYIPDCRYGWLRTRFDSFGTALGAITGLTEKTVFGLTIAENAGAECHAGVELKDFLDAQINTIKNREVTRKTIGIGFWVSYRAQQTTALHAASLARHYYLDNKTTYFGDGTYLNTRIADHGFELDPSPSWSFNGAFTQTYSNIADLPAFHEMPMTTHDQRVLVMQSSAVATATTGAVSVKPDTTYTVSAWVTGATEESRVSGELQATDTANGSVLGVATFSKIRNRISGEGASPLENPKRWSRVSVTFKTGSSTSEVNLKLSNAGSVPGTAMYWDYVQFEQDLLWTPQ